MTQKIYVFSVGDDTPYHEGVEYWYQGDLNDLLDIIEDSWSWVQDREFHINIVTIGEKPKDGYEEIELIPANPEEMLDEEIIEHPKYEQYSNEIFDEGDESGDEEEVFEKVKEKLIEDYQAGNFFSELDVSEYETYPENELEFCKRCDIFYLISENQPTPHRCPKCEKKLKTLDDKVR